MTDQFQPPNDDGRQEEVAAMVQRRMQDRAAAPVTVGTGMKIVRGAGELLITCGVVLLLLVVYELYVTDIFSARKQAAATVVLDEKWQSQAAAEVTVTAAPPSTSAAPTSGASTSAPATSSSSSALPARTRQYDTVEGEGFAKLYIPAFGDYVQTVIEGTNDADLYIGPGHYVDTQYPGQPGNFAVAGHRVSKGAPFNDLDLLKSCDAIVVETQSEWFVYRVMPLAEEVATWNPAARPQCAGVAKPAGEYAGVVGRSIVLPSAREVIHPVPGSPSVEVPPGAEPLLTLTTCHPQFSDAERMIVHAVLTKSYPKSAGFSPTELGEVT